MSFIRYWVCDGWPILLGLALCSALYYKIYMLIFPERGQWDCALTASLFFGGGFFANFVFSFIAWKKLNSKKKEKPKDWRDEWRVLENKSRK